MKTKKISKGMVFNFAALVLLLFVIASCERNKKGAVERVIETAPGSRDVVKAGRGNPEKGEIVYGKYCFYCHGREGRGDGAIGIAVTPHPVDFVGDKRKMAKSDEELFKSISEGIRREVGSDEMAMPRWKDILTEDEIWDALAYVRKLSKGKK